MMFFYKDWFKTTILSFCILCMFFSISLIIAYFSYGLPSYKQLKFYEPPVLSQVYDKNGKLIYAFAQQKRKFLPIKYIPKLVQDAFIATEDQNFYHHFGIDIIAITRAGIQDIIYFFQGRRLIGASTITQQVAKNFLLNNSYSFGRKIKEGLLALKIDAYLPKERILELYLNQIYLGHATYGVDSAALYYFHKSLSQLDIAQIAYLASLPKGPNLYKIYLDDGNINQRALKRRNWVITRLQIDGYISTDQAQKAIMQPLDGAVTPNNSFVKNYPNYFLSEIRKELLSSYGYMNLYAEGFSVYTTYDPTIQAQATQAFVKGILQYDQRHGYRGPYKTIDLKDPLWFQNFQNITYPNSYYHFRLALVYGVTDSNAYLLFQDESKGILNLTNAKWARPYINDNAVGHSIDSLTQILKKGDIVFVEETSPNNFTLRQLPQVNGGMIVMSLKTGRIFAMVGGWQSNQNNFNRATQAYRQVGSAIKPFLYATALEKSYNPMTFVSNEPFVFTNGKTDSVWNPKNFNNRFSPNKTLFYGLTHSENLLTLHLAFQTGLQSFKEMTMKTGLYPKNYTPNLSMALGSKETTLKRLVGAYASLVTGKLVTPSLLDKIIDKNGSIVFQNKLFHCVGCKDNNIQALTPLNPNILKPSTSYQILKILEQIPKTGTARRLAYLHYTMGGKTGTTNEARDAWYIGFTPDIIVGVYVGFDTPRSLGHYQGVEEQGASVALPIFQKFIQQYIKNNISKPFDTPSSIDIFEVNTLNGTWPARGKTISMPLPKSQYPPSYKQTGDNVALKSHYIPTGLY